MERNLMVAGFGGQGVMTLGKFLADAACNSTDKNVTFFPSYGAEQRGGTANCYVVIADEEIGAPLRFISPKAQALWAMSFATLRALSGRWPACDTPLCARCFLRRTRRRKKRIGSFSRRCGAANSVRHLTGLKEVGHCPTSFSPDSVPRP